MEEENAPFVHVSIPDDEDDFIKELRDVAFFKARIETYLVGCDAFVVLPKGHTQSIIVPRAWIQDKDNAEEARMGDYLLDKCAKTEDGVDVSGHLAKARVIEELSHNQLLLWLTEYARDDWFSGYVVCSSDSSSGRFTETIIGNE